MPGEFIPFPRRGTPISGEELHWRLSEFVQQRLQDENARLQDENARLREENARLREESARVEERRLREGYARLQEQKQRPPSPALPLRPDQRGYSDSSINEGMAQFFPRTLAEVDRVQQARERAERLSRYIEEGGDWGG